MKVILAKACGNQATLENSLGMVERQAMCYDCEDGLKRETVPPAATLMPVALMICQTTSRWRTGLARAMLRSHSGD